MNNTPKMKIGIVGVSRDCFPADLTIRRRKALVDAYAKKYDAELVIGVDPDSDRCGSVVKAKDGYKTGERFTGCSSFCFSAAGSGFSSFSGWFGTVCADMEKDSPVSPQISRSRAAVRAAKFRRSPSSSQRQNRMKAPSSG